MLSALFLPLIFLRKVSKTQQFLPLFYSEKRWAHRVRAFRNIGARCKSFLRSVGRTKRYFVVRRILQRAKVSMQHACVGSMVKRILQRAKKFSKQF